MMMFIAVISFFISFRYDNQVTGSVLVTGNVSQNLALQVHGWVGRLAFPPPRILEVPSLRHFFCGKYGSILNMCLPPPNLKLYL